MIAAVLGTAAAGVIGGVGAGVVFVILVARAGRTRFHGVD